MKLEAKSRLVATTAHDVETFLTSFAIPAPLVKKLVKYGTLAKNVWALRKISTDESSALQAAFSAKLGQPKPATKAGERIISWKHGAYQLILGRDASDDRFIRIIF